MSEPAFKYLTVGEFLIWDDGTDRRYQLVRGVVVAMAPPLEAHGTIVGNAARGIGNRLRRPWRVVVETGVRLPERDDTFYQADLVVTCAPPKVGARWIAEPRVIVEVLSPSTADHDRSEKLDDYQALPSVSEIVIVFSDRRRVQLWRRRPGFWQVEDLIGDAELRLESVEVALPLVELYQDVALESA